MNMNAAEALNQRFFLAINADGAGHSTMVGAATLVADDLIYLVPVLLLALWFWGTSSSRGLALKAVAVSALAFHRTGLTPSPSVHDRTWSHAGRACTRCLVSK